MKKEKKYYYLAALFSLFFLFSVVPKVAFGWSDPYVTSSTVTESYTYTEAVWVDCHWVFETNIYVCERCPGSGSHCRPYCTRDGVYGYYNCYSSQCRNTNHTVGSLKKHAEIWKSTCGGVYCSNVSQPSAGDHWEYVNKTGYRDVTVNTCHYISGVNSWTTCSPEGVQVATGVTWSSVGGTSCSNVALARSCTPPPRHNVNVYFTGPGSGWVNGSGMNCGSGRPTCSVSIVENSPSPFVLTAHDNSDSIFAGWSGCPSPSGASCSGSMGTTDINATANFTLKPVLNVKITGCGTVKGPNGWTCSSSGAIGPPCPPLYAYNTRVALTEDPTCSKYHFGSWSEPSCSGSRCSIDMSTTNKDVTAYFAGENSCPCDKNSCDGTCLGQPCKDSCNNMTCKGTLACPLWQEVQP